MIPYQTQRRWGWGNYY